MTKAIVLPPKEAPYLTDITSTEDIHKFVDGWFQLMDVPNPEGTLWMNDEGAVNGMAFNMDVTWLIALQTSTSSLMPIHGTVVLTGEILADGDELTDVDQFYIDLLIDGARFTAEILLKGETEWHDMATPFNSWTSAANAVLDLKGRWDEVERVRVRPI